MADEKTIFFADFLEWNQGKFTILVVNLIILVIGPIMMGAVVWYDHNTVNLMRKNLISQMLTYLCKSLVAICIVNGISYLFRAFCSPMPRNHCDGPMLLGRWTYVYLFTHTCTRQFFKVLYIYNFKLAVRLNEDFVAFYATVMVAVFATYFTFATYMLGFHNVELDYHICTGNHPKDNIEMALKDLKLPYNANMSISFESHYIKDPLGGFTFAMFCFFVILLFQTWFYTYIMKLFNFLKRMRSKLPWSSSTTTDAVHAFPSQNNFELKQIMLGTSQTIVIFVLGFLALLPHVIIRDKMFENPNVINQELRTVTYLTKINVPLFYFVIMPLTFILFHRKFKNYIARELEARPIRNCVNVSEEANEMEFNGIPFG